MSVINVISRTQQIIIEPSSSAVAIINAGPPGGIQGDIGPPGPQGPPGTVELGYAQRTANFASSGAAVQDVTSLEVTAIVEAGRKIKVTVGCTSLAIVSAGIASLTIWMDGVQLQQVNVWGSSAAIAILRHTPAAGSHTWKARVHSQSESVTLSAQPTYPAFILVEDIGAV